MSPVSLRKSRLASEKSDTITPPFQWASSKRATIHTLEHLRSQGIRKIKGTMQCKQCNEQYEIEFDLEEKFIELVQFIEANRHNMHDRAPEAWSNPMLPTCARCGRENSLKPVINKKRSINWLFLFLGQLIGCCKLAHLKYFLKHNMNHRTAAKDRLLYLTYMGLCKQLNPNGEFGVVNDTIFR